ncbi:MAG: right-handed parallel beta-helix repeat-containing protein [Fibromonadaceae bacterium]|jgi:parallel beta-helix repeat protein|nr:right-handed parallel beta-helix repeat-containing protein [Fibromonadaceae bacterium]
MKLRFQIFVMLMAVAIAAEDFCGVLDIPTTWTKEHSPYRITGDIQIPPASRLTIEAGVTVLVATGEACGETRQLDWADSMYISIKAYGPIVIKGTAEEPVRIMPENHIPGKIQWDGIRLLPIKDISAVTVEYMYIMGANKAISSSFGKFNLGNSLFIGNGTGIWLENEADVSVYNNVFTENLSAGVYISNSRPSIVANIFYKNFNYGVWSDSRPSPRIHNNIFYANADTDCRFCPAGVAKTIKKENDPILRDKFENIYSDPVFAGSEKEKNLVKKDPGQPTQAANTKDAALHKIYEQSTGAAAKANGTEANKLPFSLSKYSPAINSAPKTDFFNNEDGSQGDIGLYGGRPGRFNKAISL